MDYSLLLYTLVMLLSCGSPDKSNKINEDPSKDPSSNSTPEKIKNNQGKNTNSLNQDLQSNTKPSEISNTKGQEKEQEQQQCGDTLNDKIKKFITKFYSEILSQSLEKDKILPMMSQEGLLCALEKWSKGVNINGKQMKFWLGDGNIDLGIINLSGFLVNSMQESLKWGVCDENPWDKDTISPFHSCGQNKRDYSDDAYYGDGACGGVKKYHPKNIKAITSNLECTKGSSTEGCCWWGRGSIQLTGQLNYGLFNSSYSKSIGFDICEDPELICKIPELFWASGIHYWITNVQNGSHAGTGGIGELGFKDAVKKVSTDNFLASDFVDLSCAGICGGSGGKCASWCHINERMENWKKLCSILSTDTTNCLLTKKTDTCPTLEPFKDTPTGTGECRCGLNWTDANKRGENYKCAPDISCSNIILKTFENTPIGTPCSCGINKADAQSMPRITCN